MAEMTNRALRARVTELQSELAANARALAGVIAERDELEERVAGLESERTERS